MLLSLALLMAGCTSSPTEEAPASAVAARALRLAYSNNLDGETEPCG